MSASLYGSDCYDYTKQALYESADVVFLGKLLLGGEDSEQYYTLKVDETFKGSTDSLVTITKSNSISMDKGQYWLVYANENQGDFLYIDACSGSKSFEWPISTQDYGFDAMAIVSQPDRSTATLLEHLMKPF